MIKVLHIYNDLNVAGAQTVIMNYLRYLKGDKEIEMTLLVNNVPQNTAYEQECQQNGYSVLYSGYQPWSGCTVLRPLINWIKCQYYIYREIRRCKPDIIHSHITSNLPFVTLPALLSGVKVRVHTLHSDPDVFSLPVVVWARFAFRWLNVYPICVTQGQAQKAVKRYGIKQYSIIRNGIDIRRFANIDRQTIRQELGIAADTTVIGCVGRFDKIKNHPFLLHLFAEYLKENDHAVLMLVGEGPERGNIEKLTTDFGITDKVLFTGLRNDVERLYYAMNLFMLTSFHESSSIVTVEAQMAGVRCVIADSIPADAVVTNGVNRIPLNAPPSTWIAAMKDELPHDKPQGELEDFSFKTTIHSLKQTYKTLLKTKK